jgi:hypothetical protein
MSKTLIITSTAGLLLCAGFLGLARAIGGDDIFHDTRTLGEMKPLIDLATQKSWKWNGGDTLALDAPINIRYQPNGSSQDSPRGAPQVSVTGPEDVLRHVRVRDGRIATDTSMTRVNGRKVEAIVSGAPIRKFVVNNGQNLDLGEIDQPALDLHLNGSGTVTGHGKVNQLNLVIAGSSKAELGGLSVTGDANISLLGSGDAALSPHGSVKLFIAGSGKLVLLTKPTELRQTIVGSGEVEQLAGEAAKAALKSLDVSRIASEAANNALQSTLGNGNIGRIAADAARKGIEGAQIEQEVQRGVSRGLSQSMMATDARTGSIDVPGSSNIDLGHIEQEELKVTIAGSGSVTAEGKVNRLTINIPGSGQARLGKLAARNVSVMVMGSGDAIVAPSEELKATIMGSGDVHVLTRPARIERSIMGSGHIIEGR